MANRNKQLSTLLIGAGRALRRGRKGVAEKKIREAYRTICTPATEAEIAAARLFYETHDIEIDMDALASHPNEKDDMGVWVQAWVWVPKPAAICSIPNCDTIVEGDEGDLREHATTHEAGVSGPLLQKLRNDPMTLFIRV